MRFLIWIFFLARKLVPLLPTTMVMMTMMMFQRNGFPHSAQDHWECSNDCMWIIFNVNNFAFKWILYYLHLWLLLVLAHFNCGVLKTFHVSMEIIMRSYITNITVFPIFSRQLIVVVMSEIRAQKWLLHGH